MDDLTLTKLEEAIVRIEAKMVTKDDLATMEKRLVETITEDISEVMHEMLEQLDTKKANKVDLDDLETRVDKLERKVVPF